MWALAAGGRILEAAELATEQGRLTLDRDLTVFGAQLLHDAARLSRPEPVAPDLRAIASQVGGALIPALADHAEALVAHDGGTVAAVAERFASIGSPLLAVESSAQASRLLTADGQDRAGKRAAVRAHQWSQGCVGARTPAMLVSRQPLTAREQEVPAMAVAGLSNRQIGAQLGRSKRTADNHLASIYRKLGVTGREELAALLSPLPTDPGRRPATPRADRQ